MKPLLIEFPEDIRAKLEDRAKTTGLSMSAVVKDAVYRFFQTE